MGDVSANSVEGQVDQLSRQFAGVERSARAWETHERKGTALLYGALQSVYAFGVDLGAMAGPPGVSMAREFFVARGASYTSRTRENLFIGLVRMAFATSSDSSRSQYSTVLNFARRSGTSPNDFIQWLNEGGIEGRRDEAMEAMASKARARNNEGRVTRMEQARAALGARAESGAVALPGELTAPVGYAMVLARIDEDNRAYLVDVLQRDDELESTILRYAPAAQPRSDEGPLAGLLRAVAAIARLTPAKIGRDARDVLVRADVQDGQLVTVVEGVSKAYSFPACRVTIERVAGLAEEPLLLRAADVERLTREADARTGWRVEDGAVTADELPDPVHLQPLAATDLRRGADFRDRSRAFTVSTDQARALADWITRERGGLERRNKAAKQRRAFPAGMTVEADGERMMLRLSTSVSVGELASSTVEAEFDGVDLATRDVEALASTLAELELSADGWVIDNDVDEAALAVELWLGEDQVYLLIPTRTGSTYNYVCEIVTP